MIESRTFRLEPFSYSIEIKPSKSDLELNQLISEAKELAQKVRFIQLHFIGPDYFGLEGNFSDLVGILQKATFELESHKCDLDQVVIENELDNLSLWKKGESIFTDKELIASIVFGLGLLIQSSRKFAIEAEKVESFVIKESLESLLNELEKNLWIFTLFSKY